MSTLIKIIITITIITTTIIIFIHTKYTRQQLTKLTKRKAKQASKYIKHTDIKLANKIKHIA